MNTEHPPSPRHRPTQATGPHMGAHALIWVLLAVAAVLLVGFIAVVDDITQRGELRRAQQRASVSWLPADALSSPGVDLGRLLSMTGKKLAGR